MILQTQSSVCYPHQYRDISPIMLKIFHTNKQSLLNCIQIGNNRRQSESVSPRLQGGLWSFLWSFFSSSD